MANAFFLYENEAVAVGATVAASSEADLRPASYLSSPARWKKWRSGTSTGDQTVTFTWGAAVTLQAVALVDYLAHVGGSVKAEYWTGAAWAAFDGATGVFTLPSFNPGRCAVLTFAAGRSTTSLRLTFTNTAAVSSYVELGVCVAGAYFQPTYNIIDGFELEPVDESLVVAADGGEESAHLRRKYYRAAGTFEMEPEAVFDGFRALFDEVGFARPMLFAIDPADADEVLYCRLEAMPLRHVWGDYWTVDVAVREVR